jgi:transposase-like protein
VSIQPQSTGIIIDTTFFGKRGSRGQFGILVVKSTELRKVIYATEVASETLEAYIIALRSLASQGWQLKSVVCDGKPGLIRAIEREFPRVFIQMCQFHQIQIIKRYLPKKVQLPAGQELRKLTLLLTKTDKESFLFWLQEWYLLHGDTL